MPARMMVHAQERLSISKDMSTFDFQRVYFKVALPFVICILLHPFVAVVFSLAR